MEEKIQIYWDKENNARYLRVEDVLSYKCLKLDVRTYAVSYLEPREGRLEKSRMVLNNDRFYFDGWNFGPGFSPTVAKSKGQYIQRYYGHDAYREYVVGFYKRSGWWTKAVKRAVFTKINVIKDIESFSIWCRVFEAHRIARVLRLNRGQVEDIFFNGIEPLFSRLSINCSGEMLKVFIPIIMKRLLSGRELIIRMLHVDDISNANLVEDLGMMLRDSTDLDVSQIKYKSIGEAHDDVAWRIREEKHKLREFDLKGRREAYLALDGREVGEWTLKIPRTNLELFEWGDALRNCIGSYEHVFAEGECELVGVFKQGNLKAAIELKTAFTFAREYALEASFDYTNVGVQEAYQITQFSGFANERVPEDMYEKVKKALENLGVIG